MRSYVCTGVLSGIQDAYIKGLGGCMKVFKSANGGEFFDTDLLEALEREGIAVQHTSSYSPHQNGISERTNRILFELAFALMYAKYAY